MIRSKFFGQVALGIALTSAYAATSAAQTGPVTPEPATVPPAPTVPQPVAPQSPTPPAKPPMAGPQGAPAFTAPVPPPAMGPPPADAPAKPKRFLNYKGDFWSRYELRSGYWEKGLRNNRLHRDGDTIVYRARLGLKTDPVDIGGAKGSATIVPQAAGTFGTGSAPQTIADTFDLRFYEAFFTLQGDAYKFDVGRFMMDYGDAAVIGNLGWNETARAFQGMRSRFSIGEDAWLDAFVTLIQEGTPTATDQNVGNGDRYFYGLYADVGPLLSAGMNLDLYALGQTWGAVTTTDDAGASSRTDSATQVTLGARIKQKIGLFDYRVEGGFQTGSRPAVEAVSLSAFNIDGTVGVSPVKGLRIGVGGLIASGDDPETDSNEAWDQLFPTAHKFLGLSDVAGARSNIQSLYLQLKYAVNKGLIFKADGHTFSRVQVADGAPTSMGSELNLHAIKKLGGKGVLRAMYAVFLADEEFWPTGDPVHFLEIQYGLKL